jgi:hypothetical protein
LDGVKRRINGHQIFGGELCRLRVQGPRKAEQRNTGEWQDAIDYGEQLHELSFDCAYARWNELLFYLGPWVSAEAGQLYLEKEYPERTGLKIGHYDC